MNDKQERDVKVKENSNIYEKLKDEKGVLSKEYPDHHVARCH
jgi:hypothetical protein